MSTIYKYPIIVGEFDIETSNCFGSPVLVELQAGKPCMWLQEPKPNKDMYLRRFKVFGTGQDIPDNMTWVASWQDPPYIWHLHEVQP